MLAGHASGCLLSELGAGVPYNREEEKKSSLPPDPPPRTNYAYITKRIKKFKVVFSSCTCLTLISSQSAIAQSLKLRYYRELVPLIALGSPQPLVKTLALLGPH